MRVKILILILILSLLIAGCTQVQKASRTIIVDDDGTADYRSIQEAINVADPGDIIEVHSGVYLENVNVTKPVILKGIDTGEGKPIVSGDFTGSVFVLSADGIWLEGFVITNSGRPGAGVEVKSNNNTIINNIINNNGEGISITAEEFIVIVGYRSYNGNRIINNVIKDNVAEGIHLYRSNGNLINLNKISNNGEGIVLDHSYDNIIIGNTLENSIVLDNSGNNTLRNNLMSGFEVKGWKFSHFNNDIDMSNLVNGREILYLLNAYGYIISSGDYGVIYCVNCSNIYVTGVTLTNNSVGVYFFNTTNSVVENCSISNCDEGIYINKFSTNNRIESNHISGGWFGVTVLGNKNTITKNVINDNEVGIFLNSNYNTVKDNIIRNNKRGIDLQGYKNVIADNDISDSTFGILGYSREIIENNTIYNNIFINNKENILVLS